MNITFMIGNGFDLNIGLKTRYTDFYPYFMEKASETNMIKEWLKEDEKLWSDLERELGQHISKVTKDSLDRFFTDKDELDRLLINYLEEQEKRISDESIHSMLNEFIRSIRELSKGLPVLYDNGIIDTRNVHKNEKIEYHLVTFNYTNVIDRLIEATQQKGDVFYHSNNSGRVNDAIMPCFHIHGTTESEMILGVNDNTQINNELLKDNDDLMEYMIKSYMNNGLGQDKIQLLKNILDHSHIIYIYGMSLGETDNMWWEHIIEWLVAYDKNRLIYFAYTEDLDGMRKLSAKNNRLKRKITDDLLKRKELTNEVISAIKDRIYVIFEPNIFLFEKQHD